jgi:hypothetical protein
MYLCSGLALLLSTSRPYFRSFSRVVMLARWKDVGADPYVPLALLIPPSKLVGPRAGMRGGGVGSE